MRFAIAVLSVAALLCALCTAYFAGRASMANEIAIQKNELADRVDAVLDYLRSIFKMPSNNRPNACDLTLDITSILQGGKPPRREDIQDV